METMELVSNPTISLKAFSKAIDDGYIGDVEIVETVSGRTTKVKDMIEVIDNHGIGNVVDDEIRDML